MRIIDGIELLKEIKEGKLNSRDKFYVKNDINPNIFFVSSDIYRQLWMFREGKENIVKLRAADSDDFINNKFIIEDNMEEIDDLKGWLLASTEDDYEAINATLDRFGKKINELVKVVNKLMKGGKE